jgi:hypothetical protein
MRPLKMGPIRCPETSIKDETLENVTDTCPETSVKDETLEDGTDTLSRNVDKG